MDISYFLFLLIIILFFLNPSFFDTMYNNKLGRFILIVILIILSLNNLLLAVLFIIVIIVLSQFKPSRKHKIRKHNSKSDHSKHKTKHKSKRQNGVNIVQVSEMFRPKSSKVMVVFPSNTNTTPYTKNNFYEIKTF